MLLDPVTSRLRVGWAPHLAVQRLQAFRQEQARRLRDAVEPW
jgi:hypothetical protein